MFAVRLLCNSRRLLWTSSRWSRSQCSLWSGRSKRRELQPNLQYIGAQRPQTHSVYCWPDHSAHREQDHSESREHITVNAVNWPAVKTGNKLTVKTGHFLSGLQLPLLSFHPIPHTPSNSSIHSYNNPPRSGKTAWLAWLVVAAAAATALQDRLAKLTFAELLFLSNSSGKCFSSSKIGGAVAYLEWHWF